MLMPLYTVNIDFEDRTFAIEQVEAETPQQSLKAACQRSQALAEHDSSAVSLMTEHAHIYQVAEILGVWNWHPVPGHAGITADLFGGIIVQTDPNAPKRRPSI
jgi:hypothetical protein